MTETKHIRQTLALLLLIACLAVLTGCQKQGRSTEQMSEEKTKKLQIMCTIFPEYDWVRELTKDVPDCVVSLLIENGSDVHSYQPTIQDVSRIGASDLLVYVGGPSDEWVADAVSDSGNKELKKISLLELSQNDVKEEETVEGMEEEKEAQEEESGEKEYDEHVWMSLRNAQNICGQITEKLCKIDADHRTIYQKNLKDYQKKLKDLDRRYEKTVEQGNQKTILVADRFPFRYLVDDYHLNYYAAFPGCNAETEASFETLVFLSKKVDELGLKAILVTESSDQSIARTVISSTRKKNQEILTLNSLQSIGKNEIDKGVTYLSIMEENRTILQKALR